MMSFALLAGQVYASDNEDNATATATAPAAGGTQHIMTGCIADYSAEVALFRTITFKKGSTTLCVVRWDFSKGPCILPLPGVLRGDPGGAVSVELQASGSAGVTGRVNLFAIPK